MKQKFPGLETERIMGTASMHTYRFVFAAALMLSAQALVGPAWAGQGDELKKILAKCDLVPDKACEQQAWSFTDVSQDGKLSKAEITRFLRLAAVLQAGGNEEEGHKAEALAFFVGPFGAQSVLDNFDYDGDGFIAKAELFHEMDAVRISAFAAGIMSSGKDALALGGALAGKTGMNPLAGSGLKIRKSKGPMVLPKRSQAASPQPDRAVQPPKQVVISGLKHCWSPPKGPMPADDNVAYLRVLFYPDGRVRGAAEFLNAKGEHQSEEDAGTFAKSVQSALYSCAPYALRSEVYGAWQILDLKVQATDVKK